jgi:alkanesulfonate monooxygenase SsuD/methylene tetrahydromethanopterin reductase-like flavin-dependent oxidoreductase (luciferase family)
MMSDTNDRKPNLILTSKNKVKLGVFGLNGPGAAFTLHPDRYTGEWSSQVRVAQKADRMGIEAVVSAAHWKAFGGDGHYSGDLMETFTWAGGMAASTENIAIISTLHITVIQPMFAAKAVATVDLISNGRAGMNLVLGWNEGDMNAFAVELEHPDDRYSIGEEWMQVFDRLCAGEPSFDFNGDFIKLKQIHSQPRQIQDRPVLLNAGSSPRGREFAAKNVDVAFVIPQDPRPEAIKEQVDAYRAEARSKFGREIQIWMSCYVVQRDTAEEARAYAHDYVVAQGDDEAVREVLVGNIANFHHFPQQVKEQIAYAFKAGWGGYGLVGTADDIADKLEALSNAGVDGFLMTWLDYEGGLARFDAGVMPLLEKKGLRAPASKA